MLINKYNNPTPLCVAIALKVIVSQYDVRNHCSLVSLCLLALCPYCCVPNLSPAGTFTRCGILVEASVQNNALIFIVAADTSAGLKPGEMLF